MVLSVLFTGVILFAWGYAIKLQQTVASNKSVTQSDPGALIEVERLRNLVESQMNNSRGYFLLGSKSIFDKQQEDRKALAASLVNFGKQYSLPEVPGIIKRIEDLEKKNDDFFDQAVDFKEKKTESRIVGQFYQSKMSPLLTQINAALDEIASLHKAEMDRSFAEAREAAASVETQIPTAMAWFTGSLALLFLGMALLIIRMLRERQFQLAARNRLYEEAKKALRLRDETLFAISNDLNEPLNIISEVAGELALPSQGAEVRECGELIKSTVTIIEGFIKDIRDEKRIEMEGMTLRLEQMSIDNILESARLLLQPLAKKEGVSVQFDTVNPPVLAFFDPERVLRVLSNLVGNAIKFSPKGSKVVVKVRSDQKFVNISVLDSGPGIPESQLPDLMENYWQAKKTADKGAGVGLSIVKTIIDAHGGTVDIKSQVGRGTTFTFSLPRRRPVGAPLKKLTPTVRKSRSEFYEGLHQ
ncbi:Alkaline phosphatase synthesis sensor protein PhoR [compost metagenome]